MASAALDNSGDVREVPAYSWLEIDVLSSMSPDDWRAAGRPCWGIRYAVGRAGGDQPGEHLYAQTWVPACDRLHTLIGVPEGAFRVHAIAWANGVMLAERPAPFRRWEPGTIKPGDGYRILWGRDWTLSTTCRTYPDIPPIGPAASPAARKGRGRGKKTAGGRRPRAKKSTEESEAALDRRRHLSVEVARPGCVLFRAGGGYRVIRSHDGSMY